MVIMAVLCRTEGVLRMMVRGVWVKSKANFSTMALQLLAEGKMEDRRESREEELHIGELWMVEEVEVGKVVEGVCQAEYCVVPPCVHSEKWKHGGRQG